MATSTIIEPIEIKSKKSIEKLAEFLDKDCQSAFKPKSPKNIRIINNVKKIVKFFN